MKITVLENNGDRVWKDIVFIEFLQKVVHKETESIRRLGEICTQLETDIQQLKTDVCTSKESHGQFKADFNSGDRKKLEAKRKLLMLITAWMPIRKKYVDMCTELIHDTQKELSGLIQDNSSLQ